MNKQQITTIFQRLEQQNPTPTTELNYQTQFELLVAVILSAQATDASVNKVTEHLFKKANTPEKILALEEEGLQSYIKSINYYRSKTKNILKMCQQLIENHHSEVPTTREELEKLGGVGRKTANVILNTAFGESTIAVDTHVFRLGNRIGFAPGKTPLDVEKKLMEVVPSRYLKNANHWLILHGRYVCTARNPHCEECVINDLCEYYQQLSANSKKPTRKGRNKK